mgnify:CR=1 FL=1
MALLSHPTVLAGLLKGTSNAAQGFSAERDLRRAAERQRSTADYTSRLGMMEKSYEQQLRDNDPMYQQQRQANLDLTKAQTTATLALGTQRTAAAVSTPLDDAINANKAEAARLKVEEKAQDKAERDAQRAADKAEKDQEKLDKIAHDMRDKENALRFRISEGDYEKTKEYVYANPELFYSPTWIHYQNTRNNPVGAGPAATTLPDAAAFSGVKGAPGLGLGVQDVGVTLDPLGAGGGVVGNRAPAASLQRDPAQRQALIARARASGIPETQIPAWLAERGW